MRTRRTTAALLVLALLLPLLACGGGGDDKNPPMVRDVPTGKSVQAQQVSFWDPQVPRDHSTWGRLVVNPAALERATGIQRGWLNVATQRAWVVVNLPLPPASEGMFAVYFDLGLSAPQPLQEIALHVKVSDQGLEGIADEMREATTFLVDPVSVVERGLGPEPNLDPDSPPWALRLEARVWIPLLVTTWVQATTNAQCAQNQCATMATANGFQYLEDMAVWVVPHVHDMGLSGDATLVGQLDTLSGRTVVSRAVGSGLDAEDIVEASLEYVTDNGIAAGMTFRHQDSGWASSLPAANYSAHGLTSQYDGAVPSYGWLRDRVRDGCAVTAGYSHSSGGHMVRVTGMKIDDAGNLWMRYTHDSLQTGSDPADTLGLETVWVQLSDLDGDGLLNLGAASRELRVVCACCP